MSSSLLIGSDFQITPYVYNTILNAVNLYLNNHSFTSEMILPSLNSTTLITGYQQIIYEENMTLRQLIQTSNFRFFLFKMNNSIYSIVTNLDVSIVYKVEN